MPSLTSINLLHRNDSVAQLNCTMCLNVQCFGKCHAGTIVTTITDNEAQISK